MTRHTQLPAMFIHYPEIHQQVRRQLLQPESIQWHFKLFLGAYIARQCLQQRGIRGLHFLTKLGDKLRHGH